jgi:hypothetical protein
MEERIKHFKKQTQKLHLEALEAEADLKRVNEAVRASRVAVERALKSWNRPASSA